MDVTRIWDQGEYYAFTDLIRYQGRWLCVFRDGTAHVGDDGALRVIASDDGEHWQSIALLIMDDFDLRDPKFTPLPDGRLQLHSCAMDSKHKKLPYHSVTFFSDDGEHWQGPDKIGEPGFWIWRSYWHQGRGYGLGYGHIPERIVRLYQTQDGLNFQTLVPRLHDEPGPSEYAFVFGDDHTCYCLIRRDNLHSYGDDNGLFGIAKPPYTDWRWFDTGHRIGGPAMIALPDGRLVAAVRKYEFNAQHQFVREWLELCWVNPDNGQLETIEALPSGYDCSYAGMVWHEDELWVSYYSSHEEKPCIYLARGPLPPLT